MHNLAHDTKHGDFTMSEYSLKPKVPHIFLKQIRKQNKMTQAQAAQHCAVCLRTWGYWEKGDRRIPYGIIEGLQANLLKKAPKPVID